MFPNVPVAGWANAAGFSQETHGALFAHGPALVGGCRIGKDLIHALGGVEPYQRRVQSGQRGQRRSG